MFKRAGVVNVEVKCEGETRVRPDIEIILSDRSLLVDVAVVHPAAPSRRSLVALAAARDIETRRMPNTVPWHWSVEPPFQHLSLNPTVLLAVKDWNC